MSSIAAYDTRELMYDSFPKNGIGAELGVWFALNSRALLLRAKPRKLFLVDPWQCMYGSEEHLYEFVVEKFKHDK